MLDQFVTAIENAIPGASVDAKLEGNHLHVTVVSTRFEGQSPVKKQQSVYAALNEFIASGALHAVHMKTLTPSEAGQA